MSAIESNNVTYAAFTAVKVGHRMSSMDIQANVTAVKASGFQVTELTIPAIVMYHQKSNTDPVWKMYPLATALVAPASATLGQVMAYRGLVEGWGSSNIDTNLSTNFSGLIKGSNGYLAQAEAGTDYMAPIAVTSADNGKVATVMNGVWSAKHPTSYRPFSGASVSAAGAVGLVPSPNKGQQNRYLKGDGTWADVLPQVAASDNGKFLRVVDGAWAAVSISDAHGGNF